MIKSVVFALVLSLTSISAHAYEMSELMASSRIQELVEAQRAEGFRLTQVTDVFAEAGTRPRCLCESFNLKFKNYQGVETLIHASVVYGGTTSITLSSEVFHPMN